MDTIEEEIAAYEAVSGIKLSAHNRATFRAMVKRENLEAAMEWLHEELQAKHGEARRAREY